MSALPRSPFSTVSQNKGRSPTRIEQKDISPKLLLTMFIERGQGLAQVLSLQVAASCPQAGILQPLLSPRTSEPPGKEKPGLSVSSRAGQALCREGPQGEAQFLLWWNPGWIMRPALLGHAWAVSPRQTHPYLTAHALCNPTLVRYGPPSSHPNHHASPGGGK